MKFAGLLFLSSALGASAAAVNYTDSNSGISFAGFTDPKGECTVGIALPDSPSTDFIANIVGPVDSGDGWAGLDLSTLMANHLLLVAWPNGEEIVVSPRLATGYTTPSVYSGDVTLSPIASGTFVNSTHFSATFLCAGCITGGTDSITADADSFTMGYAYSTSAVTDPTDSSSALSYHSDGFGGFGITAAGAKSSEYATWAAMAESVVENPGTGAGSNSTVPGNSTVTPITTSNVTYDYIIAGAGPAGLVAAGRLAETGASVLLIERGGPSLYSTGGKEVVPWNSTLTAYDIPAMAYYLSSSVGASTYCTDTASMAGCILGGSGTINALMFVKPQDADFDDNWPAGWKAADVRKASGRFFKRNPGTDQPSADGQRYDQGAYDVLSSFLGVNDFTSVSSLEEPNKKTDVYAHPPWNIDAHMRGGPLKTYLPLAQAMDNFKLSMNSKVIRAVRNGTWVSGVEIEKEDGSHEIIKVTQGTGKVLLAAGALSTPRILFYSGIGPSAQIEAVPSSVTLPAQSQWIDLPVGEGVMDHPIISITLGTKSGLSSLDSTAFTAPDNSSIGLWNQGSGLLTQGGQRLNFWTSVTSPSDGKTRFLQGTCNSPSADTVKIKLYVTHGLTSSTDLVLDSATGENTVFTGTPYLQTEGDTEAYEGFLDRLIAMAAKPNSTLLLQLSDGSAAPGGITGAELLADLNSTLTSGSHFVRSARMGTSNDSTAVVDTNTKVYGTDNLFVVDASMHPDLPTGNTQAIVMVAAERAVERILALDGKIINDEDGDDDDDDDDGSISDEGASGNNGQQTGGGSPPAGGKKTTAPGAKAGSPVGRIPMTRKGAASRGQRTGAASRRTYSRNLYGHSVHA